MTYKGPLANHCLLAGGKGILLQHHPPGQRAKKGVVTKVIIPGAVLLSYRKWFKAASRDPGHPPKKKNQPPKPNHHSRSLRNNFGVAPINPSLPAGKPGLLSSNSPSNPKLGLGLYAGRDSKGVGLTLHCVGQRRAIHERRDL